MAERGKVSLLQATAINLIDMVGIGPFIVSSSVISIMAGPQAILAWIGGAILAFLDAFVWSELGAAMPEAGGSYVFLRETFGSRSYGQVLAFLFIWQTLFQSSFVVASGAIGFANYVDFITPLGSDFNHQLVSAAAIALIVIMLFRRIESIGTLSMILAFCVVAVLLWIVLGGLMHGQSSLLFAPSSNPWHPDSEGMQRLGDSMQSTVYAFLGYYNVCHLGSEIEKPQRNIPRSMFISVAVITVLYLAMQLSLLSVVPLSDVHANEFFVSSFIERCYGHDAALVATALVLIIALSSLFAVVLGYSRIPFAAAKSGQFLSVFARQTPSNSVPYVSLLFIGGASIVIIMLTRNVKDVVAMILTMRILVQFVGQSIGLIVYRRRNGAASLPFRMLLYPLPLVISVAMWIWLYASRPTIAIERSLMFLCLGLAVYIVTARSRDWFPFGQSQLKTDED